MIIKAYQKVMTWIIVQARRAQRIWMLLPVFPVEKGLGWQLLGIAYIATYAKDSTADDPIVKVGNHQVRINDVDPKNATELEMFALMSYMDKNGMTNNRGISSYTKMKAFSGQAEYNGFCEGIYDSRTGITEKYDWISILNNAKETFLNIAQTYSQAVEIDRMIFALNEKTIWNTWYLLRFTILSAHIHIAMRALFLHQLNMVLERFLHFSGVNAEISLGDVGRGVLEEFHYQNYIIAIGFI